MEWIKWILALVGHLGIWCVAYNRIHATSLTRYFRKFSEKIIFLIVALPIVYVVTTLVAGWKLGIDLGWFHPIGSDQISAWERLGNFYLTCCLFLGVYFVLRWVLRRFRDHRLPAAVLSHQRTMEDLSSAIGVTLLHGTSAKLLGLIPGNQVQELAVESFEIQLDVPSELDGLKICQLSDLHFTGQIDVRFFKTVVERANDFQPDLIVITGDLVDRPDCLSWLDSTLGQLRAELGVYYVLGNHDCRIKAEKSYRNQLAGLGLKRAAGQWIKIDYNGVEIQLTGNELPWYSGAENLPTHPGGDQDALKILLSHSPDQIDWADPYDFDLMFAGHTHGGQIRLPVIGPLVAPSKYGVLYASGTFQIGNTLMHVSRGLSGDEPIRIGCPPELGLFTIRSSQRVFTPTKPSRDV